MHKRELARMTARVRTWVRVVVAALTLGLAAPAHAGTQVVRVDVSGGGDDRTIRIVTNNEPTFTVFRLSDPMRVVVDISGGDVSSLQGPLAFDDGVLGQVATRQFAAGGFQVGRVIVGFEKDLAYHVRAEGNAVVIRTGAAADAPTYDAAPPPVAPVDRAAAERFESAKAEADRAAQRASQERELLQAAEAEARRQQQEAQKLAKAAESARLEAEKARKEAESLGQQATRAVARDRAELQKLAKDAEARRAELTRVADQVAAERAAAERLAAQAEQARREALQTAARAEADHKARVAELQAEKASAVQEKQAAQKAWEQAKAAKAEADQAHKRAEKARDEASASRNELTRRLADIDAREKEMRAALAQSDKEREALAKREAQLRAREETLSKDARASQAALDEQKAELQRQKAELERERAAVEASRKQVDRERQELDARKTKLASLERKLDDQAQRLQTDEAQLQAAQSSLQRQRNELSTAEKQLAQRETKATRAEADEIRKEKERLTKERTRLDEQRQQVEKQQARIAADKNALAKERVTLASDRASLSRAEKALTAKRKSTAHAGAAAAAGAAESAPVELAAAPVEVDELVEDAAPSRPKLASAVPMRAKARSALTGVRKHGSGPAAGVLLSLTGQPRYQVQRVEDPPRLVIDLHDTDRGTGSTVFNVESKFVRRVRLGDHGSMLRAVLDLTVENATHALHYNPDGLVVTLEGKPEFDDAVAASVPTPSATGQGGGLSVRDVTFDGKGDTARIVLDVDPAVATAVDQRSQKAWVLELGGTTLPKSLERSLDTTAYGTVVRLVSAYQDSPRAVKIVASLTGPAKGDLKKEGGRLVWEIRGNGERAGPAEDKSREVAAASGSVASAAATVGSTSAPAQSPKRRISIDLKDADIVNVLRLLSEVSGENIITSDEVSGKITLRLRNVPWDKALETILKAKGYDMVRQDNILRIAPAEVIARERERELERRTAEAKVEDTVIKIVTVNYATAGDISEQLKPMLTPRGTVQVDNRTNTIVLEDIRSNIDRIVQLTRRLDKQTPQVLIEARIVEATTNELQHLGIQWGGTSQASSQTGNPTGLLFPSDVLVSGAADAGQLNQEGGVGSPARYAVNLPAPIGSGGGGLGFVFGSAGGSQVLNLRLTALEETGKGRIISSPRITTLDNRTATISQGVDIPVSVVSAAGVNTRFVQARLKLEVTPHVTNDGSVLMKIRAEKNEPDFANVGGNGDPSIVKKEAETEVLVRDGETTVIGGIYTRTTSETQTGIPFLSSIPVLGWLFKSTRSEDTRSEMLIFVTPRIVNREASSMVAAGFGEEPPAP